jgi:hypothetical protein
VAMQNGGYARGLHRQADHAPRSASGADVQAGRHRDHPRRRAWPSKAEIPVLAGSQPHRQTPAGSDVPHRGMSGRPWKLCGLPYRAFWFRECCEGILAAKTDESCCSARAPRGDTGTVRCRDRANGCRSATSSHAGRRGRCRLRWGPSPLAASGVRGQHGKIAHRKGKAANLATGYPYGLPSGETAARHIPQAR